MIFPYEKHGFVDHTLADHTYILKFVESVFDLPHVEPNARASNH